MKKWTILGIALGLLNFSIAQSATLEFGMTTALSGPASALGQGVKTGVEAHFHEVNTAGGINGNTLKLIALDDGYEPKKAGPNMRTLIEKNNVLAVMGNVGTPTAIVTVPIANEDKTLLFGAFTGAGVLRQTPPDRYVINYRASYAQETAAMIKGLLAAGIKPTEIAFFTQNDGYGDAGYNGASKALKASGFNNVASLAHGRYERNTKNVEQGLATILDAVVEPKAIIMVGAYKPCAAFIKLAKEDYPDALFLNVSFVGSAALSKELGDAREGVIITQVVPHPMDDTPLLQSYRKAIQAYNADLQPDFVSLEGYILAKVFVEGLKAAGDTPTRESVINGLESLHNLDIGLGEKISYSATDHEASSQIWPTMIESDGTFKSIAWTDLAQ